MYLIRIECNSTPDSYGWNDFITLKDDSGVLFSGIGSSCPNPIQPSTGFNWRDAYGWIATGVYEVETVDHNRFGRCVVLNGGGEVKARFANINHGGKCVLTEVFIHEGNRGSSNPTWRGSAGCPTIPPVYWREFISALPTGKGLLEIVDGGI